MKRIIALLLCAVLTLSSGQLAMASGVTADILYTLGLVEGTESGYELDRVPTRLESLVFTLRLSGLEDEAMAYEDETQFSDVPDWGKNYVAYAFDNEIITGVDENTFGSDMQVRDKDFYTMILRTLGYSDVDGDFTWASSATVAVRMGLIEYVDTEFDRASMFECALTALSTKLKDSDDKLIDVLITSGDIDRAKASALGLTDTAPLSAREISERYTSSIVFLTFYETSASLMNKTPDTNASGFLIREDGIVVTNYHSIDNAIFSVATLSGGEEIAVDKVLYHNEEADVAVLRLSDEQMDGTEISVFPYLNMVSSETAFVGDPVFALGNPLGLQNSISSGIISNKDRVISAFAYPMIQNTASISSGSSGGALLNEFGDVIGITSGYFSYGKDMYLAVPIDAIMDVDLDVEGVTLRTFNEEFGVK